MESDTNEAIAWILGRRSIRKFAADAIPETALDAILEAAMAAPSACGKDPWRFIVVTDSVRKARIAEGLPNGAMLAQAPAGIVVCGDIHAAHDRQPGYMLQDVSAAIENSLLAAHSLGLGACWLGVYPREERVAHIRRICGIPEPIHPVACIALGYPAEEKSSRTRFKAEFVWRETMAAKQ